MGRFENHIRNVETTVSSIPRTQVSSDDVLERLAILDKKIDSQPLIECEIINSVEETDHELQIFMVSSSAANAQRVCTINDGDQDDHTSDEVFTDDEEGLSRSTASKPQMTLRRSEITSLKIDFIIPRTFAT